VIELKNVRKLYRRTRGFRGVIADDELNARGRRPPPYHPTAQRPVEAAERQIKVAGEHVVRRGQAGTKGTDIAHNTRMYAQDPFEGNECRLIDDFA
jgi:hypothetical protein